jgi:hypothetical protein
VDIVSRYLRPGTLHLGESPPLSLYVHLPWCIAKCPYCDFNSHARPEATDGGLPEARYLDALLADLEAGATGAMTGGGFADGIRPIIEAHRAGDKDQAFAQYQRWLPLINHENRQAGFLAAKALMKAGGVIACDAPRAPWPALHPEVRRQLLDIARRLDPLVLRWAR